MENTKDLASRIPDVPVLSDEKTELSGFHKVIHDFKLGRIERKELEEKRKVYAETRLQLLKDRTREVIEAYRIHATAAKEIIIVAAEKYVLDGLISYECDITDIRQKAVKQAVTNYYDLISTTDESLPNDLKDIIINQGRQMLDETIDRIRTKSFDLEATVQNDYPEKKSFFDKLKG